MAEQNYMHKVISDISLEELKKLGDDAFGLKLLVKSCQGTYVGICNYVQDDFRQILLEQVYEVNTEISLLSIVVLFYQDINSIGFLGIDTSARKRILNEIYGPTRKSKMALMKQIAHPCVNDDHSFGKIGNFVKATDEIDADLTPLSQLPKQPLRPISFVIIDSFGPELEGALNDLERASVLSFFACGLDLSRAGGLVWLCLCCAGRPDPAYLLDVANLDADRLFAVNATLTRILVDSAKTKIMHDSRRLLDYLFHRHGIVVMDVFDTQASNIYLESKRSKNEVPLMVKQLSHLLQRYLRNADLRCNADFSTIFPTIEDKSIWLERPLSTGLAVLLVNSVLFLGELRRALLADALQQLTAFNHNFTTTFRNGKKSPAYFKYEEEVLSPQIRNLLRE